MKYRIISIMILLAVFITPVFAESAIQITNGSDLNKQLNAGSNNTIGVSFKSIATIPVQTVFRLNITRATNITSEFTMMKATLNGVDLKIVPVINGSVETWYLLNTSNTSSTVTISPGSTNKINVTIFVHEATEPETVTMKFSVDTEDVLVDVDRVIQQVPGSVQYVYLTRPVNQTVTVEKVVEKIPQEILDQLEEQKKKNQELSSSLDNSNKVMQDALKQNQALATQNKNTREQKALLYSTIGITSFGWIGTSIYQWRKTKMIRGVLSK